MANLILPAEPFAWPSRKTPVTASAPFVPQPESAAQSQLKPARVVRSLQKGMHTRAIILDAALGLASHMGLEGLSIGALADVTKMSKSGVFAHFGSREELQIAVVKEYHAKFEEEVFFTAIREERGLPRLRALYERWVRRVSVEVDSGCIYISGAVEFDDRPGPVRDALVAMVRDWHGALHKAIVLAQEAGHLHADADVYQILFELHGLILSLHHDARFMRNPGAVSRAGLGFERTIQYYATPLGLQIDAQTKPKSKSTKPRAVAKKRA
jgi:AcrR family transcriptional regulator